MDGSRFDALTRSLAPQFTRRGILKALVGGAVGGLLGSAPAAAAVLGVPALRAGGHVRRETGTVNGLVVDRYTWRDAKGRPRSASLVRYGQGRGGYAVQFT